MRVKQVQDCTLQIEQRMLHTAHTVQFIGVHLDMEWLAELIFVYWVFFVPRCPKTAWVTLTMAWKGVLWAKTLNLRVQNNWNSISSMFRYGCMRRERLYRKLRIEEQSWVKQVQSKAECRARECLCTQSPPPRPKPWFGHNFFRQNSADHQTTSLLGFLIYLLCHFWNWR